MNKTQQAIKQSEQLLNEMQTATKEISKTAIQSEFDFAASGVIAKIDSYLQGSTNKAKLIAYVELRTKALKESIISFMRDE